MANTKLLDPFIIKFDIDGEVHTARITYAKSGSSCYNIFEVEVLEPGGYDTFCLKEKPVKTDGTDDMLWFDDKGRKSEYYQIIGEYISMYMKEHLGVILLDSK